MTQPQDAANELLMGGGATSCKFETLGDTWVGTIVEPPKARQMTKYKSEELDFWPSGDAKMQIVVPIQTEQRDPANPADDGRRILFIPPRMMTPVREAVQRAGAKGLHIGGRIAVRWVSGAGQVEGDPKVYAADYAPPAIDPGNLLAGNGAQSAATVAAPSAPAAPVAAAPAATPPPAPAAPAAAPVAAAPAGGGLLNQPPLSQAGPPPGVDPGVWAALPDQQRQAILAAMAHPATTAAPF
jgi:hypothetical protein